MSKQNLDILYDVDSKRLGGLQVCPRLTPTHLRPTPFQLMCVKYAVQV